MKILFDYTRILMRQCELAFLAFDGKSGVDSSRKLFEEICKRLAKDFLPPIDREDIASLSFCLLKITIKAKEYSKKTKVKNEVLKEQLSALSLISESVLSKTKTCGEDIRRLISANLMCAEAVENSDCAESLNASIAEFLKTANTAYFKNL